MVGCLREQLYFWESQRDAAITGVMKTRLKIEAIEEASVENVF